MKINESEWRCTEENKSKWRKIRVEEGKWKRKEESEGSGEAMLEIAVCKLLWKWAGKWATWPLAKTKLGK